MANFWVPSDCATNSGSGAQAWVKLDGFGLRFARRVAIFCTIADHIFTKTMLPSQQQTK